MRSNEAAVSIQVDLDAVSSSDLDRYGRGYPRPQLRRPGWYSLNGPWRFALDVDGEWRSADEVQWNGFINVPFAPEAPSSGIGEAGFFRACWYRQVFELPRAETWSRDRRSIAYARGASVFVEAFPDRTPAEVLRIPERILDLVFAPSCEALLVTTDRGILEVSLRTPAFHYLLEFRSGARARPDSTDPKEEKADEKTGDPGSAKEFHERAQRELFRTAVEARWGAAWSGGGS